MAEHSFAVDSWMREAQEASILIEGLENKRRVDSTVAEPKLVEVGIKLDRLESLLRNPRVSPSQPILTEQELEYRWKMLSDFRLRTRTLAFSLYHSPSPTRPVERSADASMKSQEQAQAEHSSVSRHDQEMLQSFLSDGAGRSQPQMMNRNGSRLAMNIVKTVCWTACLFLGAAALLFILVIICSAI